MKRKSLALSLFLSSPLLWATTPENTIQRAVQDSKQALSDLQQHQQQRWLNQHRYQTEEANTLSQTDLSQACLPYQNIRFAGFHLIDPTPFSPKAGDCLNEVRLNQLNRQITQAYLEKGYIHNVLQFEDDHSGALTLRVREGKIAKLSGEKLGFHLEQVLPNAIGKPLKVQDLDQALDQANRITGNNVSVDVLPAKNGEIELAFQNEPSARVVGTLGLDNNAAKTYHRWQAKAGVSVGNPLGLSDSLYLNLSHSLASSKKFTRSALLYYALPYGYWTFSGFLSASQFKSSVPLEYAQFEQRGRTIQGGLTADYVLHRGTNHISTMSAQVERIDSKNRFAGERLELQSPILTSVQLGFNHLQLLENGSLVFDFRHEQGWNKRKHQPANKYHKWNAELQLNRYQTLGEQLFRHSHQLTGQYTLNYLPGVKQEDLTGRYRVRGFNDLSASAERNVVLQNTFAWVKTTEKGQISPYLGVDFGLQKSTTANAHSEKAFGYALGLNFNQQNWSANLEWATGRLYTQAESVQQERSLFFSAQYKF